MYCSKCGTEIDDNSEYCSKCGTKIGTNQNYSQNEEKLKKYLPLILIILPLPLMFFPIFDGINSAITRYFIYSKMIDGWYLTSLEWSIQLIIQASLSVIGVYCLYTNRKLYGRILILIGIFVGLLLLNTRLDFMYLPMLRWIILAYAIALILDYYWFK